MTVPRSLKLLESELSSFAQPRHQLAAAARPGMSIHELIRDDGGLVPQFRDDLVERRNER